MGMHPGRCEEVFLLSDEVVRPYAGREVVVDSGALATLEQPKKIENQFRFERNI